MKAEIKAELLYKLIDRYQSFTKWILRHAPEIKESQRGKDHLEEIDEIEAQIKAIEEQPKTDPLQVEQAKEVEGSGITEIEDFKQYMTNLLYGCYNDGKQKLDSKVFDEFVEMQIDILQGYQFPAIDLREAFNLLQHYEIYKTVNNLNNCDRTYEDIIDEYLRNRPDIKKVSNKKIK
jgi:hypothetical protein